MALSAAGCSFLGSQVSAAAGVSAGPKNIDTWQLPLDQFSFTFAASREESHATGVLFETCMEEAGFTQPHILFLTESVSSYNPVGRKLFTPGLAAKWGYREAHGPDYFPNYAAHMAENSRELGPEEQEADDACMSRVRTRLPDIGSTANVISGLAFQANRAASNRPQVLAAIGLWRECMTPVGISDLPDTPEDMPTPSMADEFGMANDDVIAEPTITNREREIAVKDADCRVSSGFAKAAYEAEWDAQAAILAKNADAISRTGDHIAKHNALVQRILNDNIQGE